MPSVLNPPWWQPRTTSTNSRWQEENTPFNNGYSYIVHNKLPQMLHSTCCLFPLYLFSCMMHCALVLFTKCAKILNATAILPTRSTSRYRCIDASSTLHGSKPLVLSAFLNFRYAAPLRLFLRPFLDKNLLLLRREHLCSTSYTAASAWFRRLLSINDEGATGHIVSELFLHERERLYS